MFNRVFEVGCRRSMPNHLQRCLSALPPVLSSSPPAAGLWANVCCEFAVAAVEIGLVNPPVRRILPACLRSVNPQTECKPGVVQNTRFRIWIYFPSTKCLSYVQISCCQLAQLMLMFMFGVWFTRAGSLFFSPVHTGPVLPRYTG